MMPFIKVALHGRDGVSHQAKRHMPVGRALMLYKNVDVPLSAWVFSE
jgi:hypothetical protein